MVDIGAVCFDSIMGRTVVVYDLLGSGCGVQIVSVYIYLYPYGKK
jgi:hypothetical protein